MTVVITLLAHLAADMINAMRSAVHVQEVSLARLNMCGFSLLFFFCWYDLLLNKIEHGRFFLLPTNSPIYDECFGIA